MLLLLLVSALLKLTLLLCTKKLVCKYLAAPAQQEPAPRCLAPCNTLEFPLYMCVYRYVPALTWVHRFIPACTCTYGGIYLLVHVCIEV